MMGRIINKIKSYYEYPKRFNLKVSSFVVYGLIRKIFGEKSFGKNLCKILLGHTEFNDLLRQTKGKILHIGACRAEEAGEYEKAGLGAIFVEANPALEEDLKAGLKGKKGMEYIIALALDVPGKKIQFNISNNIESSSALNFSKLVSGDNSMWPDLDLKMVSSLMLESTTVASLVDEGKLKIEGIDHIVIDTQGTELKVLQGMPRRLLSQASYVTLEASTVEVYEGQDLFFSIKNFLSEFGYRPMWEPVSPHADLSFKRH